MMNGVFHPHGYQRSQSLRPSLSEKEKKALDF